MAVLDSTIHCVLGACQAVLADPQAWEPAWRAWALPNIAALSPLAPDPSQSVVRSQPATAKVCVSGPGLDCCAAIAAGDGAAAIAAALAWLDDSTSMPDGHEVSPGAEESSRQSVAGTREAEAVDLYRRLWAAGWSDALHDHLRGRDLDTIPAAWQAEMS